MRQKSSQPPRHSLLLPSTHPTYCTECSRRHWLALVHREAQNESLPSECYSTLTAELCKRPAQTDNIYGRAEALGCVLGSILDGRRAGRRSPWGGHSAIRRRSAKEVRFLAFARMMPCRVADIEQSTRISYGTTWSSTILDSFCQHCSA